MGKNSKKKHTGNSALEAINDPAKKGTAVPELTKKDYEREMDRLQVELVKLQDWVKATKARIVILFEGRDAAGKGGVITAHHRTRQPASISCSRDAGSDRAREKPDLLATLYRASPFGRRSRHLRSQLVQPRRGRARDGLLQ